MGRFITFAVAASLLVACSSSSPAPSGQNPTDLVGSCPVTGDYTAHYVLDSGSCGQRGAIRTFSIYVLGGTIQVDMDADGSHLPSFETTKFDKAGCTLTGDWTMPSPLACAPEVKGTTVLAFDADGLGGSEGVQDLECTRDSDGGLAGCGGSYLVLGSRNN